MGFVASFLPIIIILLYLRFNKKIALPWNGRFWWMLFLGAFSIVPASLIGLGAEPLFAGVAEAFPVFYALLDNVLLVGIVEEGSKLLAVYWGSGRLRKLRHPGDLLLYGIVVASGFALIENVLYLLDDGSLFLGVIRGIFSGPAHIAFTLIVLYFFLQSRLVGKRRIIVLGVLVAGTIHGCSNFCLTWVSDSDVWFIYVYLLFVLPATIAMTYVIIVSTLRSYRRATQRVLDYMTAQQRQVAAPELAPAGGEATPGQG